MRGGAGGVEKLAVRRHHFPPFPLGGRTRRRPRAPGHAFDGRHLIRGFRAAGRRDGVGGEGLVVKNITRVRGVVTGQLTWER